jgi:hypothetical protein
MRRKSGLTGLRQRHMVGKTISAPRRMIRMGWLACLSKQS